MTLISSSALLLVIWGKMKLLWRTMQAVKVFLYLPAAGKQVLGNTDIHGTHKRGQMNFAGFVIQGDQDHGIRPTVFLHRSPVCSDQQDVFHAVLRIELGGIDGHRGNTHTVTLNRYALALVCACEA